MWRGKKRLLALLIVATAGLWLGRTVLYRAQAAAGDFAISSVSGCTTPGHVFVTNTNAATVPIGNLSLRVTPSGGSPQTFPVNSAISPPNNYNVIPGGVLDLQIGPNATQAPAPATNPLANPQSIALSTAQLLGPGAKVELLDTGTTPATTISSFTIATCPAQFVSFVSTLGVDTLPSGNPNAACGPDLPLGTAPSDTAPGPCLTIQHALDFARDGDTILVESGTYEICNPIEVHKLVRITTIPLAAQGVDVNPSTPIPSGGSWPHFRVILHSFTGSTIFHVTAVGYPSLSSPNNFPNALPADVAANTLLGNSNHVLIDGFIMGGAFQPGAAAVFLDHDANTDVRYNTLGGDPLNNPVYTGIPCSQPQPIPPTPPVITPRLETFGNAAGIMLQNSDHPNIFSNAILGSTLFQFTPVLTPAAGQPTSTFTQPNPLQPQTGFGIVTTECIGLGPDSSDGAAIVFNLIDKNSNAGIWLCSDGGGGHLIGNNTVRNGGRGVLLRAISDTLMDADTISDNFQDGIVIYDASSNNTVQRTLVESQNTPGAAGIRLGDFGSGLFPLQTAFNNNTLRRNWIDVLIAGARNTTGSGNIITAESIRTAVVVQVGSAGAAAYTQPTGTTLRLNQIVSNGSCYASQGCAIRLDAGVTADVDATQNNFGLPAAVDVNTVLWHKLNDPTLGLINANQTVAPAGPVVTPGVGAPGAVGGGFLASPIAGAGLPVPVAGGAGAGTPVAGPGGAVPGSGASGAAATPAVAAPTPNGRTATPIAGAAGTTSSPVLASGAAGGSTTYSPPCSFIPVPANVGASISPGAFLSLFQPAANIYSAWRFDNASHFFQPLYFADPNAPVSAVTLHPGDVVSLCLTDAVQGPP